jgi:pyruvoyl-dependent arginine decarboxylase
LNPLPAQIKPENQANRIKTWRVPQKFFFTKGIGRHKAKLQSFELALRDDGIEKCNWVYVSSIFPPNCKITPFDERNMPGRVTCWRPRSDW